MRLSYSGLVALAMTFGVAAGAQAALSTSVEVGCSVLQEFVCADQRNEASTEVLAGLAPLGADGSAYRSESGILVTVDASATSSISYGSMRTYLSATAAVRAPSVGPIAIARTFAAMASTWIDSLSFWASDATSAFDVTLSGHFSGHWIGDDLSVLYQVAAGTLGTIEIDKADIVAAQVLGTFNIPWVLSGRAGSGTTIDIAAQLQALTSPVLCSVDRPGGCASISFFSSRNTASLDQIQVGPGVVVTSANAPLFASGDGQYSYFAPLPSPVPEPRSAALVLLGLAVLSARFARRSLPVE